MEIYNRVKLLTDKYIKDGVQKGSIGYIIEDYNDGNVEVEFSIKDNGETIAQIVVPKSDLELAE